VYRQSSRQKPSVYSTDCSVAQPGKNFQTSINVGVANKGDENGALMTVADPREWEQSGHAPLSNPAMAYTVVN